MSDNTTKSERFTIEDVREAFMYALEKGKWLPNPKEEPIGLTDEEFFEEYLEEKALTNDSERDSASGVRVDALVSGNRRGGSISISWGDYGGFYWLNESFSTRICIGWLAITYWPIDLDEMIERLLH